MGLMDGGGSLSWVLKREQEGVGDVNAFLVLGMPEPAPQQ